MLIKANSCLLVVVHMSWFVLIPYFLVFGRIMPLEISEVKVPLCSLVVAFSVSSLTNDDSIEGGDTQYDR